MGCGASRPGDAVTHGEPKRRTAQADSANVGMVHGSRGSYAAVPLLDMYRDVEEKLLKQAQDRNFDRKALNEKLLAAQGAQGLQAKSVLLQVYRTQADVYEGFTAKSPLYVNMPTVCAAGPSNAIPGSLMLGTAAELEAEVEALGRGGADGRSPVPPNTTLLGEHLVAVMKLKAMWGRKLLQITLMVFTHPVLGRVALVQPLLLTACVQRLFAEGEEIVTALLKGGASPNVRNSLHMTALLLVVAALAKRLGYELESEHKQAEQLAADVAAAAAVARLLLAAGADVRAQMLGFGRTWSSMSQREQDSALNFGSIQATRAVLHLDRYTARDGYDLMLRPLRERAEAACPGAGAQLDALEQLLTHGLQADGGDGGGGAGAGGGGGASGLERRDSAREVAVHGGGGVPPAVNQGVTWPWVQAMSNITWAVSQVAMGSDAVARRAILRTLQAQAPFELPAMSVVSVAQLREQGRIPRYSRVDSAMDMHGAAEAAPAGADPQAQPPQLQPQPSLRFEPLQVDQLPPGAVVVFVSHRWLGRGCPDDDKGTKLKQVFAIADHVAKHRRVPVDKVYLWLDYSVVDQDNPMPGVQALPVYIACCDEFVYVFHDEYWERAWCLTEQFMHWKLGTGESKHRLDPASLALSTESSRAQPPDPTYGKLAVEADRIALASMTSIMPYTLPGDESY